jgi:addiction module HigA family antidote
MGVSYTVLNEVLNAKRPVTTEYALLFEAALGLDANVWVKMQAAYNMQVAKQNKTFVSRLNEIRKMASMFC